MPSLIKSQIQTPQSTIPNCKGDIDNIILKSLRKEPERRYKTVEQFSADIWRFIDGLPVLARPATVAYRASKFFQRNKIAVIAGVLIFLSSITGMAVAIRQTNFAREQARLSAIETDKAKAEQTKSEKITKFMAKIIGYANPLWYSDGAKFGKDARVIDAILDLSEKIDVEFANEPDVAAELHHKFTDVIGANGGSLTPKEKKARTAFHARRALELRKQFYGEHHELVAKDLAYLYWSGGIQEPERAKLLMEAIKMMRETNPSNLNLPYMIESYAHRLMMPDSIQLHEHYRNAVLPPTDEDKYEIAEKMLRESLPIFRLHYKTDNSAIFAAECRLAYTLAVQEKWTDFDEHFALCRQEYEGKSKSLKEFYELVEKALVSKNPPR